MKVELALDVFVASETLRPLLNLIECFAQQRHDWVITDPALPAMAADYFEREAPGQVAAVDLAVKGTVHAQAWTPVRHSQQIPVRVGKAELHDIVHDLCRPAVLVVEDKESDGHFVRGVASVFDNGMLVKAIARGWLEIRHAGGAGRVCQIATEETARFKRLRRVAVLLDSDRLTPNEATSNHDKERELRAAKISVHVLELREAENYVPNTIVASIVFRGKRDRTAERRLRIMTSFNADQRGHYDFKHGFRLREGRVVVPRQQQRLYAELDSASLRVLAGGFGTRLLETMARDCAGLTERDFERIGPDVVAELRSLVAMVCGVV